LTHDLQSQGIDVWFDQKDIVAGDSIVERIQEGLRESDYLLVIISKNSVQSSWVELELDQAFARDPDSSEIRVIPIRLDDAEMPRHLETIRYIDIRTNYEAGLAELMRLFKRDQTGRAKVDEIIDVEKFAKNLGAETRLPKGAEFYVGTALTFLTLVVTVLAAIPAFQGILGNRARVYYNVARHELMVPPGEDEDEIRSLLEQKGLADATLHISLINKGDAKAGEVKVSGDVSGEVKSVTTEPPAASRPVWVDITVEPVSQGERTGRVKLNNLVPERPVAIYVGYMADGSTFDCDVVCDGHMATRVNG